MRPLYTTPLGLVMLVGACVLVVVGHRCGCASIVKVEV